MPSSVKCSGLNGDEMAALGTAIRSLGVIEREDNRKALIEGKRNGICPHFSDGCPVVILAHRETCVVSGCNHKPCPFDPPAK